MRLSEGAAYKTIAAPGYEWRHGCAPTALAMLVGYYDGNGFPDLIPGDAWEQTAEVDAAIASSGSGVRGTGQQLHYEDYCLPMDAQERHVVADDSPTWPTDCHPDACLADFLHTSWSKDGNFYGWTRDSRIVPAFTGYVGLINPQHVKAGSRHWMSNKTLTFELLKNEIDNRRPMLFLVDTTGDGGTDHFVTVVGYCDGPTQQYGCLDTWDPVEEIRWCEFRKMSSGKPWGIHEGYSFRLQHPLTVTASRGSVTRSPSATAFDHNASVTLSPEPQEGYHFVSWSGDVPAEQDTDNPLVLAIDATKSINAHFERDPSTAARSWMQYQR